MTRNSVLLLGLVAVCFVAAAPPQQGPARCEPTAAPPPGLLRFEANAGQADARVEFMCRGRGYALFVTACEAVLRLASDAAVRMRPAGARPATRVEGLEALPGRVNHFVGDDPDRWRTGVPTYGAVACRGVYDGVDLVYHGNEGRLEYDFVVAPGADPGRVAVAFEGVDEYGIDPEGDLVLHAGGVALRHARPVAYQEVGGQRRLVDARFEMRGGAVGFALGDYDRTRPLVIDPVLHYSTYLGGSAFDLGRRIEVDAAGNVYICGWTFSNDFPGATGFAGGRDAFVTKINVAGDTILWSTYLGSSGDDAAYALAVDPTGHVYVAGSAKGSDFPTVGPYQASLVGVEDGFVTKLGTNGATLDYSTYLGGTGEDAVTCIALDADGSANLGGWTQGGFPVLNPFQASYGGGAYDGFATKLGPTGSAVTYSSYVGGSAYDFGIEVAGRGGVAYHTGITESNDFPTTASPLQASLAGSGDSFVTIVASNGTPTTSTYFGGNSYDEGREIALDPAGNIYLAGITDSTDLATAGAAQTAFAGVADGYVAKLDPAAATVLYATYYGGSGVDFIWGGEVDAFGNFYATGQATSTDLPVQMPIQAAYGGGSHDGFVVKLNTAGSAFDYATYLGGPGFDAAVMVDVNTAGVAHVVGYLDSTTGFPLVNPLQAANAGAEDAFVLRIGENDSDGDGLPDLWEDAGGYTHSNGQFVPLPGADSQHKDIFVEIDYMAGFAPTDLQDVVDAFAAAPVGNPDSSTGITLHVMVDAQFAHQTTFGTTSGGNYDWTAFDAVKATNFPVEREWGIRYCLFVDTIPGNASGIARGIESSDFIVSLGPWGGGTATEQKGTFMHELGHGLGLRHGGGDELDNKPNYLSIMNRRFQLTGLTKAGQPHFDYSRWALDPLDEAALNEAIGLNGPAGDADFGALDTAWQSYFRTILTQSAIGPIDWDSDLDGSNTENPCVPNPVIPGFLSVDLNGDNALTVLSGHDDWPNLVYTGGAVGGWGAVGVEAPRETPLDEVTLEESVAETPPPDLKLKAHASRKKIKLTWKPAVPKHGGRSSCRKGSGTGAVSYVVYRIEEGQPRQQLGTTNKSKFTDGSVVSGTTYSYLVSVVDADGIESPPHGPATVTAK